MTTAQTTGSAMAKSIEYVHHYHRHYQFRSIANIQKRATGGRGLFAGLQDVKHYNVDHGWARRKSETEQPGILGSIWSRYVFLSIFGFGLGLVLTLLIGSLDFDLDSLCWFRLIRF